MSKADRIEREAKFQLSPAQEPTTFAQALAHDGYSVRPLGIIEITDTYLDTPSYALLRHGLALRVRHGIAAYEVGIKAIEGKRKGSSQSRLDIAFALPADAEPLDASTWPAEIFDELAQLVEVKPKSLQQIVVVRQQRAKSHLQPAPLPTHQINGDGTRANDGTDANLSEDRTWVAEWSQDDVWLEGPDDAATTHFRELEIELLPSRNPDAAHNGDQPAAQSTAERVAFDEFVADVQTKFDLTPMYASKFVRGLEKGVVWAHGGVEEIAATMPLPEACRLLLHQQLLQILLNEHGVRAGKRASYVHDMRVAIRRARAILRLGDSVLPQDAIAYHTKQLKRLGRALGAVRDLDVAMANLRTFARSRPDDARRGLKQLRSALKTQRKDARAALLVHLDSKRHRKFIERFVTFCATPAQAEVPSADKVEITPSRVRHTMPSRIWAAFEAVCAYDVILDEDITPPLESLHALRIHTKYLRYLIEFASHLLGRDGDTLTKHLRALQEHLGELNDAHVEDLRLAAWDSEVGENEGLHTAIADRRAELATRMAELVQTVPYAPLVDLRGRRRLARALAAM